MEPKYRVYVVAIEDSDQAFDSLIANTTSWTEVTEDALAFDRAENLISNVENLAYVAASDE